MFDLILMNLCVLPACLSLAFVIVIDTFILFIDAIRTALSLLTSSATIALTQKSFHLLLNCYDFIIWFISILPEPEQFEEEEEEEYQEYEEYEEYEDMVEYEDYDEI